MHKSFLAIGLMAALAVAAQAQLLRRPTVRASGQATVSSKPDQLRLSVGVTTRAATAQEASEQNAAQATRVIAALQRLVGTTGELKTVGYSVSPIYRNSPDGTQTITGYQVNNTVEVTTSDLSLGGKLIDAGIQAGATNVQSLRFSLKDSEPVRLEALRLATLQARRRAEAIATGLSARLGHVLSAEEGGSSVAVPIDTRALAAAGSTPTPIETGMVDLTATVTLEIELI
ncbi:MAG: SIMPL domain-containing protein [Acidobacteria bacterium]|nr:SIMPL domain-containing protein [Acidobacteriota bacterium]